MAEFFPLEVAIDPFNGRPVVALRGQKTMQLLCPSINTSSLWKHCHPPMDLLLIASSPTGI